MSLFEIPINSNNSDSHQSSPWAHIVVLPFVDPKSVEVSKDDSQDRDVLFDNVMAVSELSIDTDILSLDISETKSQFSNLANITLASGKVNYSDKLHAGDHILIWLGDKSENHEKLKSNLRGRLRCNDADSGLKFIGKINSVRAAMTTNGNGVRTVRYTITAAGFTEFAATVYFSEALKNSYISQPTRTTKSINFLSGISSTWSKLVFGDSTDSQSSQGFIRFFINVFLGEGPSDKVRLDNVYSSNNSFYIPKRLNQILTGKDLSGTTYTSILHRLIGIQKYSEAKYYPDFGGKESESEKVNEFIGDKLVGGMLGAPEIFNSTVWSLIESYKNDQLNETYTATRMNHQGFIFPHFIARQIPFTNDSFSKKLPTTKFSSLPVWKIADNWMVYSFNIGTSDASRFNFFQVFPHIMGETFNGKQQDALGIAISQKNYVAYDADIIRHGPRNKISRIYNNPLKDKSTQNALEWTELVSDWYRDGHLKFNGTIDMAGVSLPISIGDNLKISNKLFHIEQASHRYVVSDNGMKSFITSLSLSRGLSIEDNSDDRLKVTATNEDTNG